MLARADVHAMAYDDYVRALTLDPTYYAALDGLVRAATLTKSAPDALAWIKSLTESRPPNVDVLVARSKLLAAPASPPTHWKRRRKPAALRRRRRSRSNKRRHFTRMPAMSPRSIRRRRLTKVSPDRPATRYYAGGQRTSRRARR